LSTYTVNGRSAGMKIVDTRPRSSVTVTSRVRSTVALVSSGRGMLEVLLQMISDVRHRADARDTLRRFYVVSALRSDACPRRRVLRRGSQRTANGISGSGADCR